MGIYDEMAEAMAIFATYDGYHEIAAEHDVLMAGPQVEATTPEHAKRLDELRWHEDEHGGWAKFV